jgi:hypothetical protein
VGTASPSFKVDVVGADGDGIRYTGAGVSAVFAVASSAAFIGTGTNNPVTFVVNNAEQMRLTSTGLGIGTSNPANKLDVNSAATTANSRFLTTGTNTYTPTVSTSLVNTTLQLIGGGASGATTGIRISQGGSFEAFFGGVQEAGGAAAFVWQGYNGVAYAERMRLDSSGNLGLGISPTVQFDVVRDQNNATPMARFRNNDSGSGAYAGIGVNAFGNSWGFRMGSAAANSNRLEIVSDAFGTPIARVIVDSSGNLGLGVTPSAWNGNQKALQLTNSGAIFARTSGTFVSQNLFYNASDAATYIGNGFATTYVQSSSSGTHAWFTAPSGTAGNAITFTQAMTLNSSGNLLVGTTTDEGERTRFESSSAAQLALVYPGIGKFSFKVDSGRNLSILDGTTERARIDSSGNFILAAANDARIYSQGVYNVTTGSAANVFVGSDGGFSRSTSSLKYKQNIQDAVHGLLDVLALRPVTYESKNQNEAGIVYGGLIAEEVHAAGLTEFVQYAEDGTPDALAYGNMVSLCIKAIQEMKAIIDSQAERLAVLEAK